MCLAVPGLVETVQDDDGLKMAKINFGGISKMVCLEYTPEARPGHYVLVHVGFAISIIDEEEARRTYEALKMTGELDELAEVGNNEIR